MPPYVVPPAGVTAASVWVPIPVVDLARPAAILAPAFDPQTGERRSLFVNDDATYQAIVLAFRTRFASGISVLTKGNKLEQIWKNGDDAENAIRFEVDRVFKPYVDDGRVKILEVTTDAGPSAGWRAGLRVRFRLNASEVEREVAA